jgi:hypothetical protein
VTFGTGSTTVRDLAPRNVINFRSHVSQPDQVLAALEDAGGTPLSYEQMAERTGIPVKNLYMVVPRMGTRVAKSGSGFVLADYA